MSGLILFLQDVIDWLQAIINGPQPEPIPVSSDRPRT